MIRTKIIALALLIASNLPSSAHASCPRWMQQQLPLLRSDKTISLCELAKDKVILIVNTASKCGFTKQFAGLQQLHEKYAKQGLVIVGFPSNSFAQEHKDKSETARICYANYGVTFTILETSAVRGKRANPVFKYLSNTLEKPSWNFNKYLIDRNGKAVKKFGSRVKPMDKNLTEAIEKML